MLIRGKLPLRIMGKGFRYSLLMLLFSMFTPCMWADNHPNLTRQPWANNGLIKVLAEADTTKPKKDTVVIKKIKEEIKTQLIKTSELLGKIEDPSVTNFHSWRYAFMQSALPIKNQHVYYQNYNVAFNDFYMGVGDNVAIGVGYALPFFAYINPKVSLQLNKKPSLFGHAIAASNTTGFGFFTQSENQKWGNNMQLLYTLGNDFRNATIGLGYLSSSEIDGSSLMTNIGGSWAVNSNFYVVGEVWLNNRERNLKGIRAGCNGGMGSSACSIL